MHRLRHPDENVIDPIEPDGPRLDAAVQLLNAINMNPWSEVGTSERKIHLLDAPAPTHTRFIQTRFDAALFEPWESCPVKLCDRSHGVLHSGNREFAPSLYHYRHVFWLVALIRSGLHVYCPLGDEELETTFMRGDFPTKGLTDSSYGTLKFETIREFKVLRSKVTLKEHGFVTTDLVDFIGQ